MSQLVIDVETKKLFSEISTRKPEDLEVSYIGALVVDDNGEYADNDYFGFFEKDFPSLWSLMEKADRIIGFNVVDFDFPAMSPHYSGDFSKFPVLDILKDIEKVVFHRICLQAVAAATLGESKLGSGLSAVEYWREGKLDELACYCKQDVEVTAKVFKYGMKNKHLTFKNKWNEEKRVEVDFSRPEEAPKLQMTLELP